jgi:PPE-repeat protein
MKNEAELAGAIAHEMIHINQKHIVNELNIKGKSGGVMAGMGKLVGGAGETFQVAFAQAVDNAMNVLFKNGYHQTDELEADTMGVMLCAETGYEPHALVELFHRMDTSEKEVSADDRGVIASIELAKGSGKKPGEIEKSRGFIEGATKLIKRGVGSVAEGVGSVAGAVGDTAIVSGATGLVKKGVGAIGDTAIVSGATGLVKKGVGTVAEGVGSVAGAIGDTTIVSGATGLVKKGVVTVIGTVDSTVKAVTASKITTIAKITNVSYLKQLHPPFDKRIKWIENTIESQGLEGETYRTGKGRFIEYTKG